MKSCGCGDVNRMRRIPSTCVRPAAAARANSGRLDDPGTVTSRPYVFTFCPSSVTSTTPLRASPCTSARMSPIARERCGPRTSGTMQNVQALSHPGAIDTHARNASSRAAGSALGKTSVYSRDVHLRALAPPTPPGGRAGAAGRGCRPRRRPTAPAAGSRPGPSAPGTRRRRSAGRGSCPSAASGARGCRTACCPRSHGSRTC